MLLSQKWVTLGYKWDEMKHLGKNGTFMLKVGHSGRKLKYGKFK